MEIESARPMTLEEWGALPEDEPGELVDGRLEEEERVGFSHDVVVMWLGWLLGAWLAPRGGFVGGSDARFAVKANRGRKPDVAVYLPDGKRPPGHGLVRVPPDIIIEVVSPSPRDARRDRVEKVKEYAAFGVRWYWIVDPQLRSFEVLELGVDGRYAYACGATEGVVDPVPGCAGLAVDLDALWRHVDGLEGEGGEEG
jgi:Uma2 family endonuclease